MDALRSLTDDALLHRLSDLVAQSRRVEWVLVAHIAEVDARRLFAREASPSMIQYCIDVLHLSEGEAYRRITAARLSRKYPVILAMLEDGRLHLCGLGLLSKHLDDANYQDVLARATHKTKREIEKLVAELAPKPDVPPIIRKRPLRKTEAISRSEIELCPDRVVPSVVASRAASQSLRAKPGQGKPLRSARRAHCSESMARVPARPPSTSLGKWEKWCSKAPEFTIAPCCERFHATRNSRLDSCLSKKHVRTFSGD